MDKHVEAGRVEEIDFRVAPLGVGKSGGNGHLAGDFFFVVIGDGGAVVHPAKPLGGSGGIKRGRDQRRLARMPVPDHRDIPYVGAFINLHWVYPFRAKPRI